MKKYKVVGLPKMHNGGIGAGHPHKLKKNRNKGNYSLIQGESFSTATNLGPNNASPDDPIKEKKLSRKQNKELGEMSYEEMVNYVNEQNNMFKELNLPAQYKMPDLSKVYGRKELKGLSPADRKDYKNMSFYDQIKFRKEKIRSDDFYNVDDVTNQEIVDPIPTTTDIKPDWYGDDHYNKALSIISSFDKIEKEYVLPKYKQREDGSYFKVRDEISRYDLEVEELRKKYETIEAQMRASFGDREGDPTHAEDWQNRDGKLYRKQLNALGSELQNLLLTRREQAGENVGVQKWSVDPETGIPKIGMSFTRDPESDYEFNKETKDKMGYIPKNYLTDFNDVVVYPKESDLQIKQEQLGKQAELLWTLGAIEGYIPDKQVPIGGTIKDLETFVSDYETDIADFKKQKTASNAQLKDYATYIGVKNFDPKEGNLASEANYKLLRKAMGKNPSDQYLMKIYKDVFMTDFDPNAVQLNQEQMGTMIDAGWGDGSMDAIYDLAKVVAYGAPAAPFVVSGLVSLMNNPLFTLAIDGYFAYETPQMVEDFYKNAKKVMETTDPGTLERLASIPGLSMDALFVQMGISGGARIAKGVDKTRKTLTGAAKSEAELSKVLREQLSSKGKIPSGQYKQRMKESNFRKEEELIQNASLEELQARAAGRGTVMDETGNTIIQTDSPIYINYTKKGKDGVELTDASGKVISNTGTGDVIIGMGKTERVSIPGYNNVTVPELYTMPKVKQPYIRQKIKLPGGATIEIGVYNFDSAFVAMGDAAVARGAGAATKATGEANFEIAKASEVGLGEQYGNATVMAFNDGVKIGAKELETLSKEVDVVIANGQAIVLNKKAIPKTIDTKVPMYRIDDGINKFSDDPMSGEYADYIFGSVKQMKAEPFENSKSVSEFDKYSKSPNFKTWENTPGSELYDPYYPVGEVMAGQFFPQSTVGKWWTDVPFYDKAGNPVSGRKAGGPPLHFHSKSNIELTAEIPFSEKSKYSVVKDPEALQFAGGNPETEFILPNKYKEAATRREVVDGKAVNQKAAIKSPKIVDPEGLNKFNITEKDILDAANRIMERLLSPKFIKNNAAATGRTEEEVSESINKMVSEFESGKVTFSNNPAGDYGAVYKGKGKIDINVGNLGNREQALGALDHEINHVFSDMGKLGTVIPPKVVEGPNGREVVFGSSLYDTYPTVNVVGSDYINAPHEQQVRARRAVQWLEDNAGLKMGEEITTPMVEKLGEAIKNGETRFAERNTGGKWTAPPSEGGTFEYEYKKGDYMGGVDGGRSMSGEYHDLRSMFANLDIKSVLTESEISLLDKIPTGSKKWNETVKDLLNKAYQAALPLIGGAGAAMLSDSDEDMEAMGAAALPLMIFGKGKGSKAYKKIIKGIRELFITTVPIEGVVKPFKSQEKLNKAINQITKKDIEAFGKLFQEGVVEVEGMIPETLLDGVNLFYESVVLREEQLAKNSTLGTTFEDILDEYDRGQDIVSRFANRLESALSDEPQTGAIKEAAIKKYITELTGSKSGAKRYKNLTIPMNDPMLNGVLITKYANEIKKYIVNNIKDSKIKDEIISKINNRVIEHQEQLAESALGEKQYLETLDERLAVLEEVIQTGKYQGKDSIPMDKLLFLNDNNTRSGYNNIVGDPQRRTPEGEILLDDLNIPTLADDARVSSINGVRSRIPVSGDENWLENVYMNLLQNVKRYEERASGKLDNFQIQPIYLTSDLMEVVYNPELIFLNTENELKKIFESYLIQPLKNKQVKLEKLKESNLELKGDEIIEPTAEGILYGEKAPLNKGEKNVTNLKTGNPEKLKVFTRGNEKKYVKNNELIIEQEGSGKVFISENLVPTVTDNVKFIEDLTGGKVSGSAKLVEVGVSTIPGDYDVIITESAFNKNLKENKDVDTSNIKVDDAFAQKIDLNGEDVDLVIIQNGPDGLVAPKYKLNKPSVEDELFKQFFPEEFQKATNEKLEKVFKKVAQDGEYISKTVGEKTYNDYSPEQVAPTIPLKIPLTAEELLAGVDMEVKSIIDAFASGRGSGKAKHVLKSEAVLLEADPVKVAKAQNLYVKSIAGVKAEVAPDFINYFTNSSVKENISLLKEMGYDSNFYIKNDLLLSIAENPERMQLYLNDWFINNTITTRQISIHKMMDFVTKKQQKLGKDLEVTVKNVIEALTEWDASTGGGSALGAGLNKILGPGDTTWNMGTTEIGARGMTQFDFVTNLKKQLKNDAPHSEFNPVDLVYSVKSKTGQLTGDSDSYLVKAAINKVNEKYGVKTYPNDKVKNISDLMSNVKALSNSNSDNLSLKHWEEWYTKIGEIIETPFITSKGLTTSAKDRGVGNSAYAGGTNQWKKLGQSIAWTFLEDAENLKSLMQRTQTLKAQKDAKGTVINTVKQYYETKQLFKESQGKVDRELEQVENDLKIIHQKFISSVDKLQKNIMKNVIYDSKQVLEKIREFESKMISASQRMMNLQQEAFAIDAGYQEFNSVVRPWVKIVIATIAGAGITAIASGDDKKKFDELNDILKESEGDDPQEGTKDIIGYKEGGQIKRKLKRPNPQFEELELTEKEALAYAQKGYIVEAIS